jgi:hypothetical protein
VLAVSSDAVADERLGAVYKARVALELQILEVDDQTMALSPGLSATVDIRTGRRRVIDYVLMPVMKVTRKAERDKPNMKRDSEGIRDVRNLHYRTIQKFIIKKTNLHPLSTAISFIKRLIKLNGKLPMPSNVTSFSLVFCEHL